jgi:hypothetical protein
MLKNSKRRVPQPSVFYEKPILDGSYEAYNPLTDTYRWLNALFEGANTCSTILPLTEKDGVPSRLPEPLRSFIILHNSGSCEDLCFVKRVYKSPAHLYVEDGVCKGAIYSVRTDYDSLSGPTVSFGILVPNGIRSKGIGGELLKTFEDVYPGKNLRCIFLKNEQTSKFFDYQKYVVEEGNYNSTATKYRSGLS